MSGGDAARWRYRLRCVLALLALIPIWLVAEVALALYGWWGVLAAVPLGLSAGGLSRWATAPTVRCEGMPRDPAPPVGRSVPGGSGAGPSLPGAGSDLRGEPRPTMGTGALRRWAAVVHALLARLTWLGHSLSPLLRGPASTPGHDHYTHAEDCDLDDDCSCDRGAA